MKNLTFTICLLFGVTFCFAQVEFPKNDAGKIAYSDIIVVDSAKSDEALYKAAKEFFSTNLPNFQRSNSEKNFQGANLWLGSPKKNAEQVDVLYRNDTPVTLADKEDKKIIARVVNKYTGGTMGCLRVLYFEYDVILKFKYGRYKYEVTNFIYTHYNQATMKQSQIYGMNDSGDCNSKNTLDNLLKCERCKNEFRKMCEYLDSDTRTFLEGMNTFIKENKKDDDRW